MESPTKTAGKKPAIMFLELADMRDSGFIMDGTQGTPFETRLTGPSVQFVPNVSYRMADDGEGGRVMEMIRHIKNQHEISVEKQRKLGIEPHPKSSADKIMIKGCRMTIVREGGNVGLFDFLTQSAEFNQSNPELRDGATPIYRVIDITKQQEQKNEKAILKNEARTFVFGLQEKQGGQWVYQTDRINALCELFSVFAESAPMQIEALSAYAGKYPEDFLEKIKVYEQTTATVVAHALQLNVISFKGNSAMYISKDKVIKVVGSGSMKPDKKISALAEFLRSKEGHEAYIELQTEVEVAKEKKANQN